MEKFVMAGGIPVRYSDYGEGEKTICLLHEYLRSIETWEGFGGLLGKEFRTIAIDLPGHGMSDYGAKEILTMEFMADIVSEVLRKAEVEKCHMIGHSMGGYVSAAFAEKHPEKLNSLIFMHSTPNADTDEKREMRKREIEIVKSGKKELLTQTNSDKGFAPQNINRCDEYINEFAEQVMMAENGAITATLKGMAARPDRNAVIAALTIPVLFIFGIQDSYIPVENAQAVIEKQPHAEIAWIENSGHYSFLEEPKIALEIVRNFVQKTK